MTLDRSELGTNIAATDVNMKYYLPSVIEPICLPRARIARCGDAGPGWHKLSVRGARGNILNLTHDIFSVMQSDETRVWPPTRVEWCRHPDTHPPSPGAHKKHLVNSYSCSSSPAPPRPPSQVTDQMHAGLELEANGTVTGAGTLGVFCKAPLTLHQSIISNEHG